MARQSLRLFSIAFAAIISAFAYVGDVLSFAATSLARSAVELYQPTARETLELDRLVAPVAVLPVMRSRFRAFTERLLTHPDYRSGHFDPGRMAA